VYDLAVGGILSSVFIPVFVERLEQHGKRQAWHTARTVLTFATLLLTAVAVLCIVFSRPIIDLYTSGVPLDQRAAERALGSFFLKWFMPQIIFYGIGAGVATGLLNANRRFAAPMFAPIANNLIATATFLVFAKLPGPHPATPANITDLQKWVLAVGTTLGVVAMTVVLWPALRSIQFKWRPTLDFRDPGFRRAGRLAGWASVYVIANQLGYLVILVLAVRVEFVFPAYQSAFIFYQLPYAIFAVSIMTALLPSLSSRWNAGDVDGFRSQLAQGIRLMAFIVVPSAAGYVALGIPIVRLLLQYGVAGPESSRLTGGALAVFSTGLFSFCTFQLLLRAFYAMQDTRTPAIINIVAVAINTLADILLFRYLHGSLAKVEGLALGHALSYTFAALASWVVLRRKTLGLEGRRLGASLAKILLGGVAAGVLAWAVSRALGTQTTTVAARLLQVGGSVLAGGAAFLAVAVAFRMQELAMFKSLVLGRLGRR
jgi:putative peptidoglycan lipid II flippase